MKREDVIKYNPTLTNINIKNPLSIGNGDFVMTLDITSTQTFSDLYNYIPLTTISNKLWINRDINKELPFTEIDGKRYMLSPNGDEDLYHLKRQYPHKFNLYNIKILYKGEILNKDLIKNINQELDLYSGICSSKFVYEGNLVSVKSTIYQNSDTFNLEIHSSSDFNILVEFLYPSYVKNGFDLKKSPEVLSNENSIFIKYDDINNAMLYLNANQDYKVNKNKMIFDINGYLNIDLSLDKEIIRSNLNLFWDEDNSIIIDNEFLVRRMVLSKYLLKINSTGIYPPSEAGLTFNNWNSKFHLEMHLLHSLWLIYDNHPNLLEKSFDYYLSIYNKAKPRARLNGYEGIRIPKMTSPDGLDSPSPIGPLLVWQAPHIVFFLQEIYRIYKRKDLLVKYEKLISGTIDFMISFLKFDGQNCQMVDPLLECCESIPVNKCKNPLFEIEYFRHVFKNQGEIDKILFNKERYDYNLYCQKLIMPKSTNDIYLKTHSIENEMDIYPDHPTETFVYSYFKSDVIDQNKMKKTLDFVINNFDLKSFWGWDFPLMGMTAINLGYEDYGIYLATLDSLNNTYLYNGHNTSPRDDLRIYLPGNGAYLLFYGLLSRKDLK